MKKNKHLQINSFRWMSAMMLMVGLFFVNIQANAQSATVSNNTPVATVDNSTVTSTVSSASIPGGSTITSVTVDLELTHTWVGDLNGTLTSPDGTVISLFDRPGVPASGFGCSQDNILATFDDAAALTATDFENTCDPSFTGAGNPGPSFAISGTFQSIDALGALAGENAVGDWILSIGDNAGGDGGFIESVSLTIGFDALACTFNCPSNIVINLGPGECDAIVSYDASIIAGCASAVQTAGLPSGSTFPAGTTTNSYTYTDAAGGTQTCSFDVTVVEFISTAGFLTCNDNVQISLDDNCQAVVGADMILEGNVYGCYDNYTVSINGGGNVLNPSHVGLTLPVTVTDPNGNTCWGTISVEDKIDPIIVCQDLTLSCTDPLPTVPAPGIFVDPTLQTITDGGNGGAVGGMVYFDITNLTGGPLTVTSFDMNITANTMVNIYTRVGTHVGNTGSAAGWVLTAQGDATAGAVSGPFPGNGTLTPALTDFQLDAGVTGIALEAISAAHNYTNGNGANQSYANASIQLDLGSASNTPFGAPFTPRVFNGAVNLLSLPAVAPSDGCGTVNVTYTDVVTDNGCNGIYSETIVRTWTATDGSGNSASCTSTYNRVRATLDDVTFPADITIDCTQDYNDLSFVGEPLGANCGDNIAVTKEDVVVEVCEGTHKIVRTWTIIDWCAASPNNTATDVQLIKVLDSTGPSISPIADLNVSTTSNSCYANAILPIPSTSDDCSGSNISISYSSTSGIIAHSGNQYTITGLALGTHTVTVTAVDGCGNESSADFDILVEDNIAPIAICDEHTIASLGSDGTVSIPALTFDDGSYDNCEIVDYKVRRMTQACQPPQFGFHDYAQFCCADLGSVVMVELRITDASGNTNSCMVEVEVQDKLAPTIICPANKTIACDDDYTDLGLTGSAVATDNCGVGAPAYIDNVNIDNCGEGTVTRIWSVQDDSGNPASCVQFITLINNDPFNGNDITWPWDFTSQTCGTGLEPDQLSSPYDRPSIDETACDQIFVGYDDLYLPQQDPACVKILRTWTVINWCEYETNNPNSGGIWNHTQVLKVLNSSDPNLFPGGDSYVGNFEENCGSTYVELFATGDDDCTPTSELEFSYTISTAAGAYISSGNGTNASQAFANGSYIITWTVADGCSNSTSSDFPFLVEDAKKPTPVCVSLSTVIMPSSGEVTIWANDFESGSSFDNCTPYNGLQFSFSSNTNHTSRTFSCSDIPAPGVQTLVELWVTDANGNQDFCTTYILLTDNGAVCGPVTNAAVEGVIQTEDLDEVEDVTVVLEGANTAPIVTGAAGTFNFPNMAGGNYVVAPEKNMNPTNGVTTFDLVLISKHILGTQTLDSPYKMIAADANASNTITTFDIVKLRRLILQIDTEFSDNTSWRFVDRNYEFPTPTNPWAEVFPEVIDLNASSITNFVGVKIGDVNGSASPNSLLGTDTRNFDGDMVLNLEDKKVAAGEEFTLDFRASDFNNMLGYQFALSFENVDFVDVTTSLENLDTENFGLALLEEGVITTSWNNASPVKVANNEILFSLTFKANTAAQLSEVFGLSSRYTTAEAYTSNEDLLNVALNFNGTTVTAGGFELYQNTPNPFKAETSIGFNLPEAGNVTLKIYDLSGRVLKQVKGDFTKGYNQVTVNRDELSGSGVLYYQLDTQNDSQTKKMILVD